MASSGKFVIKGSANSRNLTGEVKVSGAKNDALPAFASALLFKDELNLSNVPAISDIDAMAKLLSGLGATVESEGGESGRPALPAGRWKVVLGKKISSTLDPEIAKRFRGSITLLGPVLARTHEVVFPHPGGCVIGERPIDIFLKGFEALGATVTEHDNRYHLKAPEGLHGAEFFFKYQSVTATETLMMAAVLAKGKTVLKNAAMEPEVIALGEFLIQAGAKITGLGSNTIEIVGGELLSGQNLVREIIPDRIEAGSFVILGALAGKNVAVKNLNANHLQSLTNTLTEMGVQLEIKPDQITILGRAEKLKPVNLRTHEYPGFPTDLQAPMAVLLTQASGRSTIFETIFEGRLGYLETLKMMGAQAWIHDPHQATVEGPTPLSGQEVVSPDLRAGLAYILAGIVANGQTIVHNVHYVERGYEKIEEKLAGLGVQIVKEG